MRINWFYLIQLITRARELVTLESKNLPKGDVLLYLIARSFCEQLERTNKGIANAAGFDEPLSSAGWEFMAQVKERMQ